MAAPLPLTHASRGAHERPRARPATGAVGYLRRSTDRQEQSIPDQRKAIDAYAALHGLRLVHFYTDDAISGTTAVLRKAFQELIADAQKPDCAFSSVVVYDIKRFGRVDNDEAGYYRHVLRTHGVEVRYVTENFSGDGTDDLLRPVKQWQAREESKDLSRVTIRGLLSRVDKGLWMGGTPPYGYDLKYEAQDGSTLFVVRFMPDGSKEVFDAAGKRLRTLAKGESIQVSKKDRARLVFSDPARVEIAKRIFTMAAVDEKGLGAIADTLNREGVPTPRGPNWARIYSGSWSKGTVRAILDNPIYCGDMVWNRRTDARFFKIAGNRATERKSAYGARLVPNPEVDWIRIPDAHPALVSHRLAVNAQRVRTEREASIQQTGQNPRVVGGWVGKRSRFLLSGLITCGRCGARYEGVRRTKGKRREDGSKVVTYSYGCGGYIRNGRSACTFGPLPQVEIEQAVIKTVLDAYARFRGPNGRKELAREFGSALQTDTTDLKEARERAREKIAQIDADVARLLDHISAGTREAIEERITTLRGERSAARGRIEELDRIEVSRVEADALVEEVGAFVNGLEWMLRDAGPEQRVSAIRRCVEGIRTGTDSSHATVTTFNVPASGLTETESRSCRLGQ